MNRSVWDRSTGTASLSPRQQLNELSSYIDAVNVYGGNPTRAAALRRFDGSGKLKSENTKQGELLPRNVARLPVQRAPQPTEQAAGSAGAEYDAGPRPRPAKLQPVPALGLSPKATIDEVSSDAEVRCRLKDAYADVSLIDPWLGGLAEDHLPDSNVGELIHTVLKDQFERVRDGDRFWYENDPAFSPQDVKRVKRTRLSDVIKRNTEISQIRKNVFLTR